jgi:hypothetical protein
MVAPRRMLLLTVIQLLLCECGSSHHDQTCPHHSDVVATSRFEHYTPQHNTYDTWDAMLAFHATRMDWVYSVSFSLPYCFFDSGTMIG